MTSVLSCTEPDEFRENGVIKKDCGVDDRPTFAELQEIEKHRRAILLRVRYHHIILCSLYLQITANLSIPPMTGRASLLEDPSLLERYLLEADIHRSSCLAHRRRLRWYSYLRQL
jgi:hypothetical protein